MAFFHFVTSSSLMPYLIDAILQDSAEKWTSCVTGSGPPERTCFTDFSGGHSRGRIAEYREAALSVCVSVSPSARESSKDRGFAESFIFLLRNANLEW
jgi:hypothetical protein